MSVNEFNERRRHLVANPPDTYWAETLEESALETFDAVVSNLLEWCLDHKAPLSAHQLMAIGEVKGLALAGGCIDMTDWDETPYMIAPAAYHLALATQIARAASDRDYKAEAQPGMGDDAKAAE